MIHLLACLLVDGKIVMAIEEEKLNRGKKSVGYFTYKSNSTILEKNRLKMKYIDLVVTSGLLYKSLKSKINNSLINYFGYSPEVHIIGHPESHFFGSYYSSGFKDALSISIDALGDKISMFISEVKNKKFKELYRSGDGYQKESLGIFYAAFTEFLGFRSLEGEFKFMYMSAYTKKNIRK